MAINTSSTGNLSPTMQTYYDRKLILDMKPRLVHYEYGQKRPVPRNQGRIVSFRKWTPFAAVTSPLTEGVIPNGQDLSMTEVTATIQPYGGYVSVSDMLDLTALDPVINDAVELMADQGALSIDAIAKNVLHAGTNVMYPAGATSRATVAAAHKLTTLELRKAVRLLKKNKAPTFTRGGKSYYVAIVGPDAVYDLQSDPLWQDVSKYQEAEQIYSGEIGRLFGVIIVETPEAHIFTGAGASNINVASTLVIGKDAYGVVDIEGGNVRAIVKPSGSAGTADPLDQVSTVGWKADGFAAKILQQAWMVRVEHAVS